MNAWTGMALAAVLAFAPCVAGAQQADATQPAWEQLTQAQRDELIAPVRERWNANPEDRARMQERARRWLAMPPEQRNRAHRGMHRWETMDPAERAQMKRLFELTRDMPRDQRKATFVLFKQMRTLSPTQREALRQQWIAMTPLQRDAWLREHDPRSRGHEHDRHGPPRSPSPHDD